MKIKELGRALYTAELHRGKKAFSVGWLGKRVHSTGDVSSQLREVIGHYCDLHSVNLWLGLHTCELCDDHEAGGEWWFDTADKRYVAPRMMAHYIDVHRYRPPTEFLTALDKYWNSDEASPCRLGHCTPILMKAAWQGNIEELKAVLDAGADPSARDEWGENALNRAAGDAKEQCVELLLARGTYTQQDLDDALASALMTGSPESIRGTPESQVVLQLLEAGASPNHRDKWGTSMLGRAEIQRASALAELLLEYGADADAVRSTRRRTGFGGGRPGWFARVREAWIGWFRK